MSKALDKSLGFLTLASCVALDPSVASSQEAIPELLLRQPMSLGEGWLGFADFPFLINALLTLMLAALLGATLAYHPKHRQTADTLEEIEAPKVYIWYSVIGAVIGIMVVKYGLVVGFVLFGIGGLMRFRTVLRSAKLTGLVIFVTLIGLSCGLDLPHVAVLTTVFGYVLIYVLDSHNTYRLDIRALPMDRFAAAAREYRRVLEQQNGRILNERKNPGKQRVTFIFRTDRRVKLSELAERIDTQVETSLRGSVDWEID